MVDSLFSAVLLCFLLAQLDDREGVPGVLLRQHLQVEGGDDSLRAGRGLQVENGGGGRILRVGLQHSLGKALQHLALALSFAVFPTTFGCSR